MKSGLVGMGLSLAVVVLATCVTTAEPAAKSSIRIGVYDSRGIAVAFARSAESDLARAKLHSDHREAKAKGDDERVKELEREGPWMQVRLHQQVFSTAGVTNIMAKVTDALPGIAREAGVVLIVSRWEMPYRDPSIEIVDVTLPIAGLFKPDEQTLQVIEGITRQQPIPFDELGLDPND
jgi:hypothetical protein